MSTTANAAKDATCKWCGFIHGTQCPNVRAIEYYENGSVKRVEFHGPQPQPYYNPLRDWPFPPAYPGPFGPVVT